MLQRAASNAYSWWWASHIRTKQSKWLDNDLQEMDERVNHMLHLLGEEADSFSKRAEMYYKRRPEVISSVEEAYRAYRALAERYDRVSGELHKANHTIAVAFPEQVQYAMLEEEDDNFPRAITPIDSSKISKPTVEGLMRRKEESSSSVKAAQKCRISSPQLSKEKAQEKINRLQKSILVLQTEKEFVKSSYESGIAKYWDVEKQIIDMQEEVCYYQDEFNASAVIEDDEARALMTATALKSCEDAIISLQEQRKKSIVLARMESARISSAREKLKALKGEYGQSSMESADTSDGLTGADSTVAGMQEEAYSLKHERLELKLICEKVREHFEMNSDTSVTELAEKIDELVNKVINLELTVSSQTAQINSLSLENGELEECLQNLEDEKMVLINDSNNLNGRLKQAEEDLNRVQILAETVQDEENTLRSNFTEALNNLSDIADKLQSDDHEDQVSFAEKETLTCNIGSPTEEKLVEGESRQIQEPVPISNGCVQTKMGSQTAADLEKVHESSTQEDNHLEEEKPILINDSNDLDGRLKQAEELNRVQTLTETVQDEERTLGSNFTEAFNNLSDIADKLQSDDHEDQVSFSEKETLSCSIGSPSDCNGSEVTKAFDTEEKLVEEESHQIQEPVPISNGCVRSKMGSQTAAHLEKAHEFSIQEDNHRVGDSSQTPQQTLYAGSENPVDLKQAEGFEENDLPQQADFLPPSGLGNILDPKEGEEFKEKYSSPAGDHITPCGSEYINGLKHGENCVEKESLAREHSSPISEEEKIFGDQEAMLNLQKLLLDGLEGREKILLAEYTSILRNYKETKKRLTEVEKKNQEHLHETEALIKELWKANAIKDEEIRSLRPNFSSSASSADVTSDDIEASRNGHRTIQSISFLPMLITESSEPWTSGISKYLNFASPKKADTSNELAGREKPHGKDSKLNFFDETLNTSPIEEKFRREIDTLLEEKLEYWLRFSASFNKMQEFTTKYQELQSEIEKLKDDKAQEINSRASTDLLVRPDSEPVERMLRALKTEVQVWLEQNALLRGELQSKFSSLCSIQDGITEALCTSSGNEAKFNSYQAAKFQGEVLHMQQENNKLADELQAGLDHISGLQAKIEKASSKLHDKSKVSGSKSSQYQNFKHSPTRTKIPLRSFLFGNKPKKSSFLSCINPALQKQYSDLRSAKFD